MFFLQMSGFPGSGKSTLSRRIAKSTGAIVIDHDIVKTALLESLETRQIETTDAGGISYEIEWALIDFHLSQGYSVILDSPCLYTEMLEKGMKLSKKYNVKYKYVECYLNNIEEINNRLKKRKRMISQIEKVESEETFKKWLDGSKRPSDFTYLIVDSGKPLEDYIDKVMVYMNE
ncbi:AAA family ATPase [Bacillus pseudomycoides]|uniref:ATP-binding protein n=1 Tax=Bacillus pseudomycoides TaxID=64104 RepID=A0A2B6JGD9_9BACI|nr:ATP-binding protein [Bacillus pseudomycoides]PEM67026.1 ATP-binding protein [Bacillus pseudomycoides]PFZ14071.1 ATP-binding protein [Bacillus pseudomycoides]PGC41760.1 ATP-binding protein [Bacillus pseudomycoides]PGD33472.1 ATP-binding protein [Bacillus pseudomycoides]PHB16685.1 ATP-binding protein [Bacillus pseudomycoides]